MAQVSTEKKLSLGLEKDFDREIRPRLDASKGNRLRKYCDWREIKGETRVLTRHSGGNYSNKAPYLLGSNDLQASKDANMTRELMNMEIAPRFIYGWEVLTAEQKMALEGRITGQEWFMDAIVRAMEIGEDIEIAKAIEAMDDFLPLENKMGDKTLPLYHAKNIELFKKLLVYSAGRFNGVSTEADVGAFMLIHSLDWASIVLRNGEGHIFASSEFSHMTDVRGVKTPTVCGVAIEQFDQLDKAYGAEGAQRDYIIKPGTIRICVNKNIAGASWVGSTKVQSSDNLMNGDTFTMAVRKSIGAKGIDPKGFWIFECKPEKLNEITEVALGTEKNPTYSKTVAE